jgi:hypothetical protein
MTRKGFLLFTSLVLVAGASRVFAHHSFTAAYEAGKRVEIEGVVKEFVWRNPHSYVRLDVTDKAGKTEGWTLEWGSSTQLSAANIP